MARIGLIGGTGLDEWGGKALEISMETPYGPPSDTISEFQAGDHVLLFLPRHGRNHSIAPHRVNYRANIHAMRELEVDSVVAVNAVGGISPDCRPGLLVVPDQLIDYSWGRIHSFSDEVGAPLQHVEFGHPFCNALRGGLLEAAATAGVEALDGGCVGVTQGPRLETDAEVARLQRDACDVVGMTSMPEAALAREAGLAYASLCVVANWAAGVTDEAISLEDIERTLDQAMGGVRRLLLAFLNRPARNG